MMCFVCSCRGGDKVKITLKVVDDEGTPVPDADASVYYYHFRTPLASKKPDGSIGKTNGEGMFTAEGKTDVDVHYSVIKNGFYRYTGQWAGKHVNGICEPWNPTVTVVLKRMINPVPMYAKSLETKIPEFDKPVGYDLEKGDWVKPYGKGEISDFIFQLSGYYKGMRDREGKLTITFSNKNDGIQEYMFKDLLRSKPTSQYPWPHLAPESGYQNKLELLQYCKQEEVKSILVTGLNYIYRVRTVTDDKGNITAAKYGKIYGNITFGYEIENTYLKFIYYFNPDGTRNLEFALKKNLFKKFGSGESPPPYDKP
jgi:hypothetical protein